MFSVFKTKYQKLKDFYNKYERYLIPVALVFGFIVDYVTFTNIQIRTSLIILLGHFILASLVIAFIHYFDSNRMSSKFKFIRLFAPLVIQFNFGALLGASFIFYWFSGSFSVSWPFIIIIALLMVSNEVLRKHLLKPRAQLLIYFFITFSYLSIALPFIFNSLSYKLFLLAGGLSLVVFYFYFQFLAKGSFVIRKQKRFLQNSALTVFVVMNFLYFSNIIPPIPLALREAGVYHRVERVGNNYALLGEEENFWQKILPGQTIHLTQGERIYLYAAIFAPTDLETRIYHNWQYYNEDLEEWEQRDRLSFAISGGRKSGYRGYSFKTGYQPGKWRVFVETERGQVLGKVKFRIKTVNESPPLKSDFGR